MPSNTPYQICTRCIMDTSDPEIQFDGHGECNHCKRYDQVSGYIRKPVAERKQDLDRLVTQIRVQGRGKRYDCIIGVSGGVDSTYVAYLVKQLGLRPLAVHLDNGWNSELAVANVEKLLSQLGIDLYTHVMNWEEFKDLQVSFLRASTPDSEIPTDHAIFALLYQIAAREGVRHIISGTNLATEAIMPKRWSHGHADWKYIRKVQRLFGHAKLRTFPHFSLFKLAYYKLVKRQKFVQILNYVDYRKDDVRTLLERQLGWRYYGGKHYESNYTRFFQGYILPVKFGFDKRRAHLSALICSGQLTRERALQEMSAPADTPEAIRDNREFVVKKLGISEQDFREIMAAPPKSFWDYPSYDRDSLIYKLMRAAYRWACLRKGWSF